MSDSRDLDPIELPGTSPATPARRPDVWWRLGMLFAAVVGVVALVILAANSARQTDNQERQLCITEAFARNQIDQTDFSSGRGQVSRQRERLADCLGVELPTTTTFNAD